jgi:hypothetical protein
MCFLIVRASPEQLGETHPSVRCLRLLPQPRIIKVSRLGLMSIRQRKNIGSMRLAAPAIDHDRLEVFEVFEAFTTAASWR